MEDADQRAAEDEPAVAWLSVGLEALFDDDRYRCKGDAGADAPDFDADLVIVGSGYGAAVATREFAGCTFEGRPLRICILERGDEYLSGAFPSRLADLPGHVRFSTPANPKPRGRRNGLFDLRVGGDAIALVANGVGGGSLINAGVMLEPDPAVFRQPAWPRPLRDGEDLSDHFSTVRDWLGAGPRGRPNTVADLPSGGWPKTRAVKALPAERKGVVPITVALQDGTRSVAGVPLKACIGCGDCATGCNHGAKISLDVGLLAQACRSPEVTLVTGATVLRVEKRPPRGQVEPSRWSVVVQHTDDKLRLRQGRPFAMRARFVVLAAGTLGSTEILLRSRQHGLGLSPRLGERFSANGDLIASLQDLDADVDAVADEAQAPEPRQVGPTITAMVDQRRGAGGFVVQDLAVPGPLRQLFAELFTTAGVLHALPECDRRPHTPQDADPCAVDDRVMVRRTLPVAMIGHDDSGGRLALVSAHSVASADQRPADDEGDGALRIDWPDLKRDARWPQQHEALRKLLRRSGLGGRVLPNPAWQLLPDDLQDGLEVPRGPLITVHPLGGCAMGDDVQGGVVDHLGRVFRATGSADDPDTVHFGLVVLDGSIVPTSLGINPALTIAALARRAAAALRTHWGLSDPTPAPPDGGPRPVFRPPAREARPEPTRVELVERMRGTARLADGKPATIELTLFSRPTPLRALMMPAPERCIRLDRRRSRLRIYLGDLSPLDDEPDDKDVLLDARVAGSLTIFRREATEKCPRTRRALAAWWRNRGLRDLVQRVADQGLSGPGPIQTIRQTLALASRAGAVRTLDYELSVHDARRALKSLFPDGTRVTGIKRLRYDLAASPLQQLMDMTLTECPGLARSEAPTLSLHLPFLAKEGVPLMRVVGQANQPQALADLASFGAYLARILIDGHLWSFRKPDAASAREPQRLPGRVPGAPMPQVTEIEVAPAQAADADSGSPAVPAARIRLTRYCPDAVDRSRPPVLLIHGYSASGTTFAHPTLNPGLMAHLTTRHRRDVWVLDLRSSCGMPTATHPWAFEDMGCEDIPVAVEQVCTATGFEQVDIVAHCMGSAMLFMGLLGRNEFGAAGPLMPRLGAQERLRHKLWDRDLIHWQGPDNSNAPRPDGDRPAPRSRIRRLVLSQVGPAVLVTPGNIARAYLMRYVQQFIGGGRYEFRTTGEPGLADQLLDRLLAALPYPSGEFGLENPFCPPGKRLRWVGSRHRIDALFGRVFNLANMDEATLEHIDDFFGPFCVDTVSQVIYFARFWTITDRSGFNRFVEPQRLRQRLTFPMMSLHAQQNGLADVATGDLMEQQIAPNLGPGGSLIAKRLEGDQLGHQDSLIGTAEATKPVLALIAEFLQERQPKEAADA